MNNYLLQTISSTQTVEAITIFALLIIILLSFVKYILVKNDIENKGIQKIIGGLAVFIVALLSHDIFVQMVSLFIGGLIIAREEFMQNLAIIVRSQSGDIGRNLSSSHPTHDEIEEKKQKEIQEVTTTDKTKKKFTARYDTITVDSLENVEREAGQYFKNKYGETYEQNIKIVTPSGYEFVADGVVRDTDGGIQEIIEVKHIPDLRFVERTLTPSIKILEPISPYAAITICFVVDEKPTDVDIINLHNNSKKYKNLEVGIFELKNGKLKPILIP